MMEKKKTPKFNNFIKKLDKYASNSIKAIAFGSILFYYAVFILSAIFWWIEQNYVDDLLPFISNPYLVIISGYLILSGISNTQKIKTRYSKANIKIRTFSWSIVSVTTFFFFASIIYFIIAWLRFKMIPTDLVDYITRPFIIIFPTYLAKVMLENKALKDYSLVDIATMLTNIPSDGLTGTTISFISDIKQKISYNQTNNYGYTDENDNFTPEYYNGER